MRVSVFKMVVTMENDCVVGWLNLRLFTEANKIVMKTSLIFGLLDEHSFLALVAKNYIIVVRLAFDSVINSGQKYHLRMRGTVVGR